MLMELLNLGNALIVTTMAFTVNVVVDTPVAMEPMAPALAKTKKWGEDACMYSGFAMPVIKDWKDQYTHGEEVQVVEPDFKPAGSVIYFYEKKCGDQPAEQFGYAEYLPRYAQGEVFKAGHRLGLIHGVRGIATGKAPWLPQVYAKWAEHADTSSEWKIKLDKHVEYLEAYLNENSTALQADHGGSFEFPLNLLTGGAAPYIVKARQVDSSAPEGLEASAPAVD